MSKTTKTVVADEPLVREKSKQKNIARRLYDWVLSWADTPYGTPALLVLSFAESWFFPIPPDVLQIALSAGKPRRAFWYGTVNLVGSVLGAMLGYYIGMVFWTATQDFFFSYVFSEELFRKAEELYRGNAFWAILTAAFTPIPDKVFTIAGGVCHISLWTFVAAMIIGRGMRFYLVAVLMFFFSETVKVLIEKYFDLQAIVFTVLLIGGFVLLKFVAIGH